MKYKVGDKVKIKSLEWYNANKNSEGVVNFHNLLFFDELMSEFCGKVVTIDAYIPRGNYYEIEEDGKVNLWTDEMIEGLADEPQEKMVSLNKVEKYLRENIILYVFATNLDQREEWFNNFRKTMEE